MTIIELLERNAREWPDDTALVEINPDQPETRRVTWHDFELVEPTAKQKHYRREITWAVFDEKANRIANMLKSHGIGKGKKVAILMMNCIDWLPIYFGILKTGAVVVPMNFRYAANEIEYCLKLSESNMLIFGPEFIGRIEEIADNIPDVSLVYLGPGCPTFADDLKDLVGESSSSFPPCTLTEDDDAAIYFSSGTTGFPKAILHKHRSLIHSARVEQAHHGQTKDDCFLCIGRDFEGDAAPDNPGGGKQRALHDRLAAGTVGAGYPDGAGQRRAEAFRLSAGSVAPDAHRRAARAPESGAPVAEVFPEPRLRHELRPE